MRPGSSEINETGVRGLVLQTVGRSAWWVMAPLLMSVSCAPALWASSWDQIGSYLRLIQQTGVEALVLMIVLRACSELFMKGGRRC